MSGWFPFGKKDAKTISTTDDALDWLNNYAKWKKMTYEEIAETFMSVAKMNVLPPSGLRKLLSARLDDFGHEGKPDYSMLCELLLISDHKWNGGFLHIGFMTDTDLLIAALDSLNHIIVYGAFTKLEYMIDEFFLLYGPYLNVHVLADKLKNKQRLAPRMIKYLEDIVGEKATLMDNLKQNVMDLTGYNHDIVRYYQRYCEPVQDPLKALGPTCANKSVTIRNVQKKLIKALDRLFQELPKSTTQMRVYRGVRMDNIGQFVGNGRAYNSTSVDMGVALEFIGQEPCCLLAIDVPAGTPMLSVNIRHDIFQEYEYLLPRNSVFKPSGKAPLTTIGDGDELITVHHFQVELNEDFDFTDIDTLQTTTEQPSMLDVQVDRTFIDYFMENYDRVARRALSYEQMVYDFLTRAVNVALYKDVFYGREMDVFLKQRIQHVKESIHDLLEMKIIDPREFNYMMDFLSQLKLEEVYNGDLFNLQGKVIRHDPRKLEGISATEYVLQQYDESAFEKKYNSATDALLSYYQDAKVVNK